MVWNACAGKDRARALTLMGCNVQVQIWDGRKPVPPDQCARARGNGLGLDRGVNNHPRQLTFGDEAHLHGGVDGLGQEFFHALIAQELAEFDQGGGVTGLAIFVVGPSTKELPARGVCPALHHAFVRLVEGVLQIQQGHHHAQWHAGATGIAAHGHTLRLFTKQVEIGHGHTGMGFAHEEVGHTGFDVLPGHAGGQHTQRVAQIDHVVEPGAKEIVCGGAGKHRKTPRNQRPKAS